MKGTEEISDMSYIIGSGWWCSDGNPLNENHLRKNLGDPYIRSVEFFEKWYDSVTQNTVPAEIVVVDSASPVKPSAEKTEGIRWISLPFNAKHSTDHLGRWSGWTRSVILSGSYAMASDCDYFVYVEQDCLLNGNGIVEHCIEKMRTGFSFGSGEGTPQPLQQSFFVVRTDVLPSFLANLTALKMRDNELSPEWKFLCATWWPFVVAANLGLFKAKFVRRAALRIGRYMFFDFLPVGSGRSRPIPFDEKYSYFQHGTMDELEQYMARVN